jgi:hypothetical protein
MRIGYGKLGRSMPLRLDKCGTVGGDVENVAVISELARRRPGDTFYLIGRNSGDDPAEIGLPANIINPWREWGPAQRKWSKETAFPGSYLEVEDQQRLRDFYDSEMTPFMRDLDGIVLWEGQHGSSNSPIPMTDSPEMVTKPHDWEVKYCCYLFQGINAFRDRDPVKYEEIILNADARNVRQSRDQRWPALHPVLAQFDQIKNTKHHRGHNSEMPTPEQLKRDLPWSLHAGQDGHLWTSRTRYIYSRVEINSLIPGAPYGDLVSYDETWEGRQHFGLFINEARAYVKEQLTRKYCLKHWVLPLNPAFVHGAWSDKSMQELGRIIEVAPWDRYYPLLHTVRSTFTTPSSGSGWATTKPWEAFAAGTVCFFHPAYDTQNHILRDAPPELREYLRVNTLAGFTKRVEEMNNDRDKWLAMVRMQRAHFDKAISELNYMRLIEERLNAIAGADHNNDSGTAQSAGLAAGV